MFRANLLVFRCVELGRMADFYERLGLVLVEEQHGSGPEHYSVTAIDGFVLELNPAGNKIPTRDIRFGLLAESLEKAKRSLRGLRTCDNPTTDGQGFEVYDPQNNVIEVREM